LQRCVARTRRCARSAPGSEPPHCGPAARPPS
jgi:hypothetical protein